MAKELPSDNIQKSLKTIADWVSEDDMSVRERQIRTARQLKFYWDGMTNVWWSDVAHDWRVWDQQVYEQSYGDAAFYDKRANVFKAYLESIIAALSVTVPVVKCVPDDPDNPLDISTAKNGSKIGELLFRHNNSNYLWSHALFIYCTEGAIYGYNYVHEDEKYGTYDEPVEEEVEQFGYVCAACGNPIDDSLVDSMYDPQPEDMMANELEGIVPEDIPICPTCQAAIEPGLEKSSFKITRLVGHTTKPKSRVCMEAYGLLNVKVPNYAPSLKDSPYLQYAYECAFPNARARWKHLKTKVFDGKNIQPGQGGTYDPYEAWGRTSTQYLGEYPTNIVTVRNIWIRPECYYVLNEETDIEELEKEYPDGCKVVFVNDEFAEACGECLDDHWTATRNPLADHVNFNALGVLLSSIQDITNELLSLILQTIEHGIPQTFIDQGVVDFDKYRQTEVMPGSVFPGTPKSGKSMSDAFYEIKTATLSQETMPFGEMVQQLGQFTSGALPSLFGGTIAGSSNTASEYLTSKNQAMQRLQTPWKMICEWWREMFGKAIPAYMKEIVEDERYVNKDPLGNYQSAFIRKAELEGKIGEVELEAAENLPLSWMQKKDTLMQFLQAANPIIMQALISPENLPLLAEVVGLSGIVLPGENDRQVQLEEISQLINSMPIPVGVDMMGEPMEQPSVPIEPDVDNHQIHILICRNWLTSEVGRLAKMENPDAYLNVMLHLKEHVMYEQQMMMQQAMQQAMMQGDGKDGGPGEDKGAPPTGKPQNDKVAAPLDGAHEITA